MRVIGLGFTAEDTIETVRSNKLFICEELCSGGSLRQLVTRQMEAPDKVPALSFNESFIFDFLGLAA